MSAFVVTLAAAASIGAAVERRPALPIAYVSLQQISTRAEDAKAAAAKLEEMKREKTAEIAAKQRQVEDTHLKWVNAGGMFQSSKRAQLHAQEERERGELQHLTQQAQTDLQNLQRDLQSTVRKKLDAIVDEIARQRGYEAVLNHDTAVVWAPAGTDLTAEVIDKMNRSR